jgi:hypothetical protein
MLRFHAKLVSGPGRRSTRAIRRAGRRPAMVIGLRSGCSTPNESWMRPGCFDAVAIPPPSAGSCVTYVSIGTKRSRIGALILFARSERFAAAVLGRTKEHVSEWGPVVSRRRRGGRGGACRASRRGAALPGVWFPCAGTRCELRRGRIACWWSSVRVRAGAARRCRVSRRSMRGRLRTRIHADGAPGSTQ